jgi:hypothetical protein
MQKKKANLLTAAAAHVGQNIYTKAKVLKPRKEYLNSFLEGVTGKPYRSKAKAFLDGATAGTVSPEYGEMLNLYRKAGKQISQGNISKRKAVKARQELRKILSNKGESPNFSNIPKEFDTLELSKGVTVRDLKSGKAGAALKGIKDSRLMSTFESLSQKIPKPAKNTTIAKNQKYENASKVTSIAATTIADPVTGAMNAKKVFLGSDKAKKIPGVKQLHHKMTELLVTNPVKNSFKTGKGPWAGKDIILNPAIADAQSLASKLKVS